MSESSSNGKARENFYPLFIPTEVFEALIGRMWTTKLSKGDCIIDLLAEGLYREGFLPEEHYKLMKAKYGTKTVLEKVREKREAGSVKVEVSSAKFEVHRSTVEVDSRKALSLSHVDYSKLSDEQLAEAYRKAVLSRDVIGPQLIQGEAARRGFKFKLREDGTIEASKLRETIRER